LTALQLDSCWSFNLGYHEVNRVFDYQAYKKMKKNQ